VISERSNGVEELIGIYREENNSMNWWL